MFITTASITLTTGRIKLDQPKEITFNKLIKWNCEKAIIETPTNRKKISSTGVVVEGIEDCLVRFSRCCSPVPGDDIIGYITRGRGVSIHRQDCPNIAENKSNGENERLINVYWEDDIAQKGSYITQIQLLANDRKGLLAEIASTISDLRILITGINSRLSKDNIVSVYLTIEINSKSELESVLKKLNNIKGIFEVKRKSE